VVTFFTIAAVTFLTTYDFNLGFLHVLRHVQCEMSIVVLKACSDLPATECEFVNNV